MLLELLLLLLDVSVLSTILSSLNSFFYCSMKFDPMLACYQSQNLVQTILASFLVDTIFRLGLLLISSLISLELLPSSMKTFNFYFYFFCSDILL